MVDFQSRDTSRGLSDDDDDEAETDEETTEAGADDAAADVQTGAGTEADESGATADARTDPPAGTEVGDHPGDEEDAAHESAPAPGHEADHAHGGGHADDVHEHDAGHGQAGGGGGHDHAGHHHADVEELGVAVVTVTSSRDLDHDPSGDAIQSLVEDAGHSVVARDLVADDLDGVQRAVLSLTGRGDVDVVVTTGGTGITPDDVTVEAVRPLFDKELPGFGELFRVLSYEEVGTRAVGSRATAGVSEGVPVFCLPGSEDAVRTGVEGLILAEAPHLVGLARGE
ncbi:MAG: molybdenum cofactor biosynthesis protein B [Haloarculaceae archaeon]